jgi:hypothetical protein
MKGTDAEGSGKVPEAAPSEENEPSPHDEEPKPEIHDDISMKGVKERDIEVGEEERNAFLSLSPAPAAQVGTRRLGMRRPRLDALEFSGQLCFSGSTEVAEPPVVRQKLLETLNSLIYTGAAM